MKIGKRGKDLAVRMPKAVVLKLGLTIGDELKLVALGSNYFDVALARKVEQDKEDV